MKKKWIIYLFLSTFLIIILISIFKFLRIKQEFGIENLKFNGHEIGFNANYKGIQAKGVVYNFFSKEYDITIDSLKYSFLSKNLKLNTKGHQRENKQNKILNRVKNKKIFIKNLSLSNKNRNINIINFYYKHGLVNGKINLDNQTIGFNYKDSILMLSPTQKDSLYRFSLTKSHRTKIFTNFDSLKFNLSTKELKGFNIRLKQYFLCDTIITIDSLKIKLNSRVSDTLNMKINLNKIKFPLSLYLNRQDTIFIAKIDTTIIDAKDFSTSLNKFFIVTNGLEMRGKLKAYFYVNINKKRLDSLEYYSQLKPINVKIKKYGNINLYKLKNGLSIYSLDKSRKICLYDTCNNYTKYCDISPNIINAVVLSEDGSFFYHKGFVDIAFQGALRDDILKKRLVRGASTITMQLMKNLYFDNRKLVLIKIEEIYLSWLIEHFHLLSKEKIIELYLNLIEWGPNVYGIKEATKFYFNKQPNEITVDEAIFLAMIIPRPKKFKYFFDKEKKLKPFTTYIYDIILDKMVERDMIDSLEVNKVLKNVQLSGNAVKYLN